MAQHIRDMAEQERQVNEWFANREGQPGSTKNGGRTPRNITSTRDKRDIPVA